MSSTATGKAYGGTGAIPHESGVAFRVWAPHAEAVCVVGAFNDWASDAHPMEREGSEFWGNGPLNGWFRWIGPWAAED
jgi:1,4-alpha-glucan branching enzyme